MQVGDSIWYKGGSSEQIVAIEDWRGMPCLKLQASDGTISYRAIVYTEHLCAVGIYRLEKAKAKKLRRRLNAA
jgi:hypothetical protein